MEWDLILLTLLIGMAWLLAGTMMPGDPEECPPSDHFVDTRESNLGRCLE
jgi:hypothetical protein